MAASKLSHSQKLMLARVTEDWTPMPVGVGCTNTTMSALEKRGLIEIRIQPAEMHRMFAKWDWRLAAPAAQEGAKS